MGTIVAGYDGSEQGERVLERAAELARALAATVVVVSVGRPPALVAAEPALDPGDPALAPLPIGPIPSATAIPPAGVPAEPPEEQVLLERARAFLEPRSAEAEYVAEVGDPAERLLQVAGDRNAELIVVGASGGGFLDRLLGRAIGEDVARHAHRDVLLVR